MRRFLAVLLLNLRNFSRRHTDHLRLAKAALFFCGLPSGNFLDRPKIDGARLLDAWLRERIHLPKHASEDAAGRAAKPLTEIFCRVIGRWHCKAKVWSGVRPCTRDSIVVRPAQKIKASGLWLI